MVNSAIEISPTVQWGDASTVTTLQRNVSTAHCFLTKYCKQAHGAVKVSGFLTSFLNGTYILTHDIVVDGMPTYWDRSGRCFMYYQSLECRWAVCPHSDKGEDVLHDVLSGSKRGLAYQGHADKWHEFQERETCWMLVRPTICQAPEQTLCDFNEGKDTAVEPSKRHEDQQHIEQHIEAHLRALPHGGDIQEMRLSKDPVTYAMQVAIRLENVQHAAVVLGLARQLQQSCPLLSSAKIKLIATMRNTAFDEFGKMSEAESSREALDESATRDVAQDCVFGLCCSSTDGTKTPASQCLEMEMQKPITPKVAARHQVSDKCKIRKQVAEKFQHSLVGGHEELAFGIEEALFQYHDCTTGTKYRQHARMLKTNLSVAGNSPLRARIASGELSVKSLVLMDSSELAPGTLREQRQVIKQESLRNVVDKIGRLSPLGSPERQSGYNPWIAPPPLKISGLLGGA